MDFTLGRFVSEDRQKCSVEFGVIWTLGMFNISTFWINIAPCSSRGGVASAVWLQDSADLRSLSGDPVGKQT